MKKINMILIILMSIIMILIIPNNIFASDTPPILQKLFDYSDTYYNFDNTGKTDIISNELKSALQLIHFNKNTFKSYYQQFSNKEKYNDINMCYLKIAGDGKIYLCFCYAPNNSNYDNYSYRQYDGQMGQTIPYYQYQVKDRIRIYYDPNTTQYFVVDYLDNDGTGTIAGANNRTYIQWLNSLFIYNDNNYYTSVSNFDGYASYYINNSNQRINGMVDFGFFNLDLQNDNTSVNFGNMYIGSGFVKSGFNVYLVNYDTGDILDNQIYYFSNGGIYNGRYIYQLVLEDFTGINRDTNYRLVCSTSDSNIKPFYSQSFKIDYSSVSGDIPIGTIIVSGDYQGVGSGEGFKNAINDINNNLNVVNNNISNVNNNIKAIGEYISDDTPPDDVINEFFSGDYTDFAEKMGYVALPNNFFNYITEKFNDIKLALFVNIPDYDNYDLNNDYNNTNYHFEFTLHKRVGAINLDVKDFNPFYINKTTDDLFIYGMRIIMSCITNGICCYLLINWFCQFVFKLSTFNFNALHDLDVDISLF